MDVEVTIRSVHDGTTLRFSNPEHHTEEGVSYVTFIVSIAGPRIQATATVDGYESLTLAEYFDNLAADWKGWEGQKTWSNLEDELTVTATSDKLGHIHLRFTLCSGHHDFAWTVSGRLEIESGQLGNLAREFAKFYVQSVV
jgi:hypothetical protein